MIYVIFSQHAYKAVEISSTSSIKGFSSDLNNAKKILHDILISENRKDRISNHGVVIQYEEGALKTPMWSVSNNMVIAAYKCNNNICEYNDNIHIDDLNARTIKENHCNYVIV